MVPFLLVLSIVGLVGANGITVTQYRSKPSSFGINSDEDASGTGYAYNQGQTVIGSNSYYASKGTAQTPEIQPVGTVQSFSSGNIAQETRPTIDDGELDASTSRDLRTSGSGGYGYSSGGTNYGWKGTHSGHSHHNGGIACTVCSNYDAVNSQKCCGFGYRQCCNVGIHPIPTVYSSWSNRPIGGAGYSYVSKNIYAIKLW